MKPYAETIRLFRGIEISEKKSKESSKEILELCLQHGFIFSPEIIYGYTEKSLMELTNKIVFEIGLTPEQLNSSFHKSWYKIRDASIKQLLLEQIIHYVTTYGFEFLGLYNQESVYIPNEKLEIPEFNDDIVLAVIKGYTRSELKEKTLNMFCSGIALKEDTLADLMTLAIYFEFDLWT